MAIRVGLVVVTFNSKSNFSRLKESLEAQTIPYRLIVVDNASAAAMRPTHGDLPAAAELIQADRNLGFAAGNNLAVARLDTEFIALLNPDAFPEPAWLETLVAAADANIHAAAFGSTQIDARDETRYDGLGDCYHAFGVPWRGGYGHVRAGLPLQGQVFSPCAAAALYRRAAWQEVGGFDETFFCYCEDVDLGFRLRLAGHSILQVPQAVVRHVGGDSSGKRSAFAVFHGTRNRLWTFLKNMPAPLFWLLLPGHVAITMAFLLISIFRGTGAPTWRGVGAGLAGMPAVLAMRVRTQRARRASICDLAKAFAWSPLAMARRDPVVR